MKNKKILIISPKFDPISDGLGHHTTKIFQQLKSFNHQSFILTSKHVSIEKKYPKSCEVFPHITKWNFLQLIKELKLIESIDPQVIFIQYEPFMYKQRGGINFSIVFFLIYLRFFKGQQIHILFHELFHPFQWSLKTFIMYVCHHFMFLLACLSSSEIFCSTENNYHYICRFFFGERRNIHMQYIGSPMVIHPLKSKKVLLQKLRISNNEIVLGLFGSFHPSKNTEQVLLALHQIKRPIKVLYIGANTQDILEKLPKEYRQDFEKKLIATGFANDEDCSHYFQILDGLVCFFSDGLSTRRSSTIMGLSHHCPIISTLSPKIERPFLDQGFITLFDPEKFDQKLKDYVENNDLKKIKEDQSLKLDLFFQEHFSWNSIMKKYLGAVTK